VQALATVASGGSGYGRRTVDGVAMSRLLLLMGVLQKRCGIFLARQDVYVNVVGRMRLDRGEGNAADLAVVVALVSSMSNIAVRSDTAFVGEIGLLGELRGVGSLEKRVEEARRMGFSRIITPKNGRDRRRSRQSGQSSTQAKGIEWIQCETLLSAINSGLAQPLPKKRRKKLPPGEHPDSLEQLEEILDDDDDEFDAFM
jgi:DNA repair protein RadA/Sms